MCSKANLVATNLSLHMSALVLIRAKSGQNSSMNQRLKCFNIHVCARASSVCSETLKSKCLDSINSHSVFYSGDAIHTEIMRFSYGAVNPERSLLESMWNFKSFKGSLQNLQDVKEVFLLWPQVCLLCTVASPVKCTWNGGGVAHESPL